MPTSSEPPNQSPAADSVSDRQPSRPGPSGETGSPTVAALKTPAKAKRRRRLRGVLIRIGLVVAVVAVFRMTGCMEHMFYHPLRRSTPPPPGIEGVWFDSADGTRLFGWWVPARGRGDDDPPAPTILHVHGNAGSIAEHIYFTDHLPGAGFNLFIFDFRGYGQSAGAARRRGPLIADTHAALDAILAREEVDPDRIGVYGQSLGGAIAINVMAQRPEIRVAVFESPFTSWREIAAGALGGDPPNIVARFFAWLLIPDGDRPIDVIGDINRPILVLHGTDDSIVPVSHGRRLAAEAGEWAEIIEFPGGDHNTLKDTHPEMATKMVEFFWRGLEGE